jgi:hypothetical protein
MALPFASTLCSKVSTPSSYSPRSPVLLCTGSVRHPSERLHPQGFSIQFHFMHPRRRNEYESSPNLIERVIMLMIQVSNSEHVDLEFWFNFA